MDFLSDAFGALTSGGGDGDKKKGDNPGDNNSSCNKSEKRKSWHWGGDGGSNATTKDDDDEDGKKESRWNSFFSSLMSDKSDADHDGQNDAMNQMVNSWLDTRQEEKEDVSRGKSISEVKAMMDLYKDEMQRVGEKYFGSIEFQNLGPASLFYYLEREDEVKNPSWKCRKHRFFPNLKVEEVVELNTYFHYADLAYEDDKNTIAQDLANPQQGGDPYDLVHSKLQSEPHEPGFFVAAKRGTVGEKNGCELLLAIRGTAGIEDVITDVLCDSVEYHEGRAHSGILKSGQYIVREFQKFLDEFVEGVGIEGTIELLIVGHSLGGGAASIAGFELQNAHNLSVRVVGFGTPGTLSKELGEKADYITTVVCDSDAIPRTSGETIVNVVLNIMEYDWIDKAKLDADLSLKDFQSKNGWLMSESTREKAVARLNDLLDRQVKPTIKEKSTKRLEPILFPPGKCIHLWRNGSGISGSVVPGTFFDEIDISRTMVDDHLCSQGYRAIFLQLMRQDKKDPNFSFESLHQTDQQKKP